MNETWVKILEIPLGWRVAIVMFVLWFVYMLASRGIFKLIAFIPALFNWAWFLLFRVANNLTHVIHKAGGALMIGLDQGVTDFFGGVYGFVDKVRLAIEDCRRVVQKDSNGNVKRDAASTPKKPFVGTAFLIATVLVLWIASPTWLNVETNDNAFTAAYHKYVEIEGKVLGMVFGEE
jgi:hypothetical protein